MDYEYELVDEKDPGEEYKQEILSAISTFASCWQRSENEGWFYPDEDSEEEAYSDSDSDSDSD